jgi:predicted RNase H-like nuclease (RuvC/YqgF family)
MSDATKVVSTLIERVEVLLTDKAMLEATLREQQAEIEQLRKALSDIRDQDHVELMLDPLWASRIASVALIGEGDE